MSVFYQTVPLFPATQERSVTSYQNALYGGELPLNSVPCHWLFFSVCAQSEPENKRLETRIKILGQTSSKHTIEPGKPEIYAAKFDRLVGPLSRVLFEFALEGSLSLESIPGLVHLYSVNLYVPVVFMSSLALSPAFPSEKEEEEQLFSKNAVGSIHLRRLT